MDRVEATTHSFIVKIWLEETEAKAGRGAWRGHITHVPSYERRYFENLNDIALVIAPYLEAMSIKPRFSLRVCHRLERWLACWCKQR